MYKAKHELREIGIKLLLQSEQLKESKLSERLDQMNQENKTLLREENRRIAMQMELNPHDQNFSDVPSYCDICGKAKSCEEKRNKLIQEKSYEVFENISGDDWMDDTFPKADITPGFITDAPTDY
ncbi:hypothetical protein QE152_g4333 [Popillia japonica]|uniref:Uncharacterized protein n=1 Tax=Popillia japonica TaxID=7064 RepID=A0AAW1N1A3_POPJA